MCYDHIVRRFRTSGRGALAPIPSTLLRTGLTFPQWGKAACGGDGEKETPDLSRGFGPFMSLPSGFGQGKHVEDEWGLPRPRFFAEFILSLAEGLRMTVVGAAHVLR